MSVTPTQLPARAGLSAFDDPVSVAVVGASDDPTKWGHWLARGAMEGSHRRRVYLINKRAELVLDRPCFPGLDSLPEVPQLVAFAVPAPVLPGLVRQAADLGVAAMLSVTAGVEDEDAIRDALAESGARLIGPNCLGIYDAQAELDLSWGTFTSGNLAVVSQSGQLGLEIAGLAAHAGIGISRFVSVGSQIDVTAADVLDSLVTHSATSAVALYLESFGDGAATLAALKRLHGVGKQVLLLTVGQSEASVAAARSHTGAMTSGADVVDAACRSVGAVRVDTPKQLVNAAALIIRSPLPRGPRVAIVTDGGGQGAIAADTVDRFGLDVPELPTSLQATVKAKLPTHASAANPVDLAGAGEQDIRVYGSIVSDLAHSGAVDAIVLSGYFGSYARDIAAAADLERDVARSIGRTAAKTKVPVVVHSMAETSTTLDMLRANGVATFFDIDAAVGALAVAHSTIVAPLSVTRITTDRLIEPADIEPCSAAPRGYAEARAMLTAAGVSFPEAITIAAGEPLTADRLAALPGPYVLKADWIEHKTEVGAVAVGLPDTGATVTAFQDMVSRLGHRGFVVEQLDTRVGVHELIVAARRDPVFGPTVVVGAGGITAELDPDTALELAPCSRETARAMLARLRIWPLLRGWRGRPGIDVEAAVDLIVQVSQALASNDALGEIEINPVRVGVDAAIAVDALCIPSDGVAAPVAIHDEGARS